MKHVPDYRRMEILDQDMVSVLRAMSGVQRLAVASGMYRSARIIITSAVRTAHPEWDEHQIQQEVVWRLSHGACGTHQVGR